MLLWASATTKSKFEMIRRNYGTNYLLSGTCGSEVQSSDVFTSFNAYGTGNLGVRQLGLRRLLCETQHEPEGVLRSRTAGV